MSLRTLFMGFLVLGALAAHAPVEAQRTPGPPHRPRAELERRVRQRMARMIRRELGLTREQQQALDEVLAEFREQRRELARRKRQLRYRANGFATGRLDLTPEEQRELIAESGRLSAAEAELFQAEQERLLDVLTPAQLLRFNALRERFGERIRRLRQRQGPPGRRRPGGPGPGMRGGPGMWGGGSAPGGPGTLTSVQGSSYSPVHCAPGGSCPFLSTPSSSPPTGTWWAAPAWT